MRVRNSSIVRYSTVGLCGAALLLAASGCASSTSKAAGTGASSSAPPTSATAPASATASASAPSASSTSASSGSTGGGSATTACGTADVRATLAHVSSVAGRDANTWTARVALTNIGGAPCVIFGEPTVVGNSKADTGAVVHEPIPSAALPGSDFGADTASGTTLPPGGGSQLTLTWQDQPGGDAPEASCSTPDSLTLTMDGDKLHANVALPPNARLCPADGGANTVLLHVGSAATHG
jgi:hypothetical protein